MRVVTSHRAVCVVVGVALGALAASGCSSGTATNGLENKSAAQVRQDAAAALTTAKSVHVTGTGRIEGRLAGLDLRIQAETSTGTISLPGARFEITRIGEDTYLKADQGAWQVLSGSRAASAFADRWVKVRPEQVSLDGFSLGSLAARLTSTDPPVVPTVDQTTLDSIKVVVVGQQDGSRLYVANSGPAYPIRLEDKGPHGGRFDFADYGADVHITAPGRAVDLSKLTAAELAWLHAVKTIHAKIDRPFMADINLTRSKMLSLENTMRGCGRELARIGAPSHRLQPVYALVNDACEKFSEGARCFATAARVSDAAGAVLAGTAEERIQTGAIACGFAAQGDGSNLLGDAEAKGTEITAAPPIS